MTSHNNSPIHLQIILFTTDEDILEAVAKNDFTYEYDIADDEETMTQSVESERPKTADNSEKHVCDSVFF